MKGNKEIINLRYKRYVAEVTAKRLRILIPVAFFVLLSLIFSDIYIRHSFYAVYIRLVPLLIAVFLYFYNIFHKKYTILKTVLYNIFLASIPAMMFAKYLIHYNTGTDTTNIIGIIVSIFIISLEVRTDLLNTLLIYVIPPLTFVIILISFYNPTPDEWQSLINILLTLIIGFSVNRVQNNFRFKAYQSNNLLSIEKFKLEKANNELNNYKNRLEDMVEKKTLTLKYALEKAKESDALKTQFLLNISHELRTPMNAVLGFSNIVSKKNPELKKEFDIIENNLNLLLKTIENIILLSKLQSNQTGSELSKFSINKFNETIFKQLKNCINKNKKSISAVFTNLLKDDLFFYSDKNKLSIIFDQIIDNSVKYTDSGKIELTCKQISENEIQYSVSDTGIGISEDELPYIFDAFRKAEKKDKLFGGTGIGLSIAKQLTELLKGKISVKLNQDKGITIILNLKISVSS